MNDDWREVYTVDGLLDREACMQLIDDAESRGFDEAPINGLGGFEMVPEVRNNTRVMYDDETLAAGLWAKLAPRVPATSRGGWHALGLNERFRVYRYRPGQRFRWHSDGSFMRHARERSLLTALIYLNDDFSGGATELDLGVVLPYQPRTGSCLLFKHPILHQGSAVTSGTKYVLRTDVMYERRRPRG